MKRLKFRALRPLAREDLADPFRHIPYEQRLIKAGAVDLTDNYTIETLPSGHIKITPIDAGKLVKAGLFEESL